ncbi:hypothetical protein GGD38_005516 [Chitinophagaceae bacterium OAS944]|nr:hypothetical protein [Chitinophagaceae bacterium OAS944]
MCGRSTMHYLTVNFPKLAHKQVGELGDNFSLFESSMEIKIHKNVNLFILKCETTVM